MSFFDKLTATLPFSKKEEKVEYYFGLNIGSNILTAALWAVKDKKLEVLKTASKNYLSLEAITTITDELLDIVLGTLQVEPQKILFGVPDNWLSDDNLKDEYLKLIKKIVKELELAPMAYVATSSAVVNFLEKQQGMPITAILIGFEKTHLEVIVAQGGKVVGSRTVEKGENSAVTIEKALLSFTSIETLPSKILIFGEDKEDLAKMRTNLLSHPWMSKLSFLHFPKIEILPEGLEIDGVCLAGALELDPAVTYTVAEESKKHTVKSIDDVEQEAGIRKQEARDGKEEIGAEDKKQEINDELEKQAIEEAGQKEGPTAVGLEEASDFGFMVGDVTEKMQDAGSSPRFGEAGKRQADRSIDEQLEDEALSMDITGHDEDKRLTAEAEDFIEPSHSDIFGKSHANTAIHAKKIKFKAPKKLFVLMAIIMVILAGAVAAYVMLPKAVISVYVEPKTLEKDAQVIADPSVKTMDEQAKIIPAQIVDTEVTGTQKAQATGEKQIGDPAKGTIKIINNTDKGQNFAAGTVLTAAGGLKFTLDKSASVSATASDADSKSTVTAQVTASGIGPDGNLSSGTNLSVSNYSSSQFVARAEGNFSGGTSKQVTVVSSDDQKKLLALLSTELRQKAQQSLQEKYPDKKVLAEALNETITKKTYSKGINDQASEFSLTMTGKYTGSAFNELDLKTIVGKLVTTQVPSGFSLDLGQTETQADVSSIEKSGKVIFLAKFKARLLPIINTDDLRKKIEGKSLSEAENIIKGIENVLGSDIKITPALPGFLQRIPFIGKNISITVGSK